MNNIILSIIFTVIAIQNINAFWPKENCPDTVGLKNNLLEKDKELRVFYAQAISDALEAKKQSLIAQETARIKTQEAEDAKKKICK
jgi:hypothetical protein